MYATYLGGELPDLGFAIAVDELGYAYVAGTGSAEFPTTPGAYNTTAAGGAFVAKLQADGTSLVYSTFLGGGTARGIHIDSSGNAYVTGGWEGDAFVFKVDPTGSSLLYSEVFGGSGSDIGTSIVVDVAGNAYVTGSTNSRDFPTTPGAFNTSRNADASAAFVAKLDPSGQIVYATFVGGATYFQYGGDAGNSIAIDAQGAAYVTGYTVSPDFPVTAGSLDTTCGTDGRCNQEANATPNGRSDAFVFKMNPAGSDLVYSTYFGGAGSDSGTGIDVDAAGDAVFAGYTGDDAFVAKLGAAGDALAFSTSLGGGSVVGDITLDPSGNAYVTGSTFSSSFPTTAGAFDTTYGGGLCGIGPDPCPDAFIAKLDPGGALLYGSYLGGEGNATQGYEGSDYGASIAVDDIGDVYVTGSTSSPDFPVTPGAFDTSYVLEWRGMPDAFVAKLDTEAYPITVDTSPSGLRVEVDGRQVLSPYTFGCSPGSSFTLNAPSPQVLDSVTYAFESWSDGLGQLHTIACTGPGGYTATFLPVTQPDFMVSVDPQTASLDAGGSTDFTVTVTALNGYSGPGVAVSLSAPPTGISGSCVPASVAPTGTCAMAVATAASVSAGVYVLTLEATNGTITRTATILLRVLASEGDFELSLSPRSIDVRPGATASVTVTMTAAGGFSGTVILSAEGLPAGVGASFSPSSLVGAGESDLVIVASREAVPGNYSVFVNGDSAVGRRTATLTVRVLAPEGPPEEPGSPWSGPVLLAVGLGLASLVVAGFALLLAASRRWRRRGRGPPPSPPVDPGEPRHDA